MARHAVWTRVIHRSGLERPHFCTRFRGHSESWVAPAHTFTTIRAAARRGISMLLAIQKSYELLTNYGFFAREICDTCGTVLGAVRFTRHNESEVYCSRECRGDAHRSACDAQARPPAQIQNRLRTQSRKDATGASLSIASECGKNCPVFNQKQRVWRRKNRLSRSTPLAGLYGGWNGLETALSQIHGRKERSTKT